LCGLFGKKREGERGKEEKRHVLVDRIQKKKRRVHGPYHGGDRGGREKKGKLVVRNGRGGGKRRESQTLLSKVTRRA